MNDLFTAAKTSRTKLCDSVADPEFYNGGGGSRRQRRRGDAWPGRGLCPLPRKKLNFYLKQMGFGAF